MSCDLIASDCNGCPTSGGIERSDRPSNIRTRRVSCRVPVIKYRNHHPHASFPKQFWDVKSSTHTKFHFNNCRYVGDVVRRTGMNMRMTCHINLGHHQALCRVVQLVGIRVVSWSGMHFCWMNAQSFHWGLCKRRKSESNQNKWIFWVCNKHLCDNLIESSRLIATCQMMTFEY